MLQIVGDVKDERALAEQVCRVYVGGLDVDGAAISLLTASTASQTLCVTDATAELLEDLQFSLGEGACVEAAVTGRPVLVADLHHTTEASRWPTFRCGRGGAVRRRGVVRGAVAGLLLADSQGTLQVVASSEEERQGDGAAAAPGPPGPLHGVL